MALVKTSFHRHLQSVPSTIWTITHNLGGSGNQIPIVDVIVTENGLNQILIPQSVIIIDSNTIELIFSIPRIGDAVIAL